ncbi:MAG: hypothetical protein H7202_09670 [Pedobacter sp.]|nr:hypothetical protein [Pedobacter sp.]
MKVLITGGRSALALKILRAFTHYNVVLADYGEMPNSSRFISLGEKNEDTIAHILLSNCLDEGIDMILPLHKFEISPLAKAKVLFDEFNVEILLPNDGDLSTYFNLQAALKHENWAVFRKGEALFTSIADEQTAASGEALCLNGAFYVNYENAVANLKLITI